MRHAAFAIFAAVALAGCASAPPAAPPVAAAAPPQATPPQAMPHAPVAQAIANVAPASGSLVSGRLTLVPMGNGVHIRGELGGLAPGSTHGFHVHANGDCSAADASSAGGHFNPGATPHGRAEAGPHHAGDIDNLVADGNGVAHVDAHVAAVGLGGDPRTDILGRALVVHAAPDDYRSQPSGNSGARIACGVLQAAQVPAGMPRTGTPSAAATWSGLAALALIATAAGLALRRARRLSQR